MIDALASATELLAGLRAGDFTPAELLETYRHRIERFNPRLNAIVTRAPARAQSGTGGRLMGLPVTIKDSIDVEGLPTTSGDPARRDAVASATAPAAQRLLAEGPALLGKTNVPIYTGDWQTDNRLFGRTVNPWDQERTPGGSTGGGAAALAVGMTALELGSDIGGSIRVPAAFCGVFGHRPSEEAWSHAGHVPSSSAMGVIGPLARSATDLLLASEILAGGPLDPPRAADLAGLRVAVLPWAPWLPVDPDIAAALEDLAGRLPHATTAQPPGFDLWEHEELFAALLAAVSWENVGEEERQAIIETVRSAPEPIAPAMLRGLRTRDLAPLLAERAVHQERWAAFFRDHDLLLTPVTVRNAFVHTTGSFLRRRLEPGGLPYKRLEVYPGLAALSGLPCTAFPTGRLSREGLPIGLQVMGPALEDATTLRFALLAERELGCRFAPPPLALA